MTINANLPEELIREILVRLPVKSLLKFMCVSKSWFSLISSDQFVKAHLKISTNNNAYLRDTLIFGSSDSLHPPPMNLYACSISSVSNLTDLLYSLDDENPVYDYVELGCPFSDFDKFRDLVGSCNGLVCLSSSRDIILWNPTTRKSKKLPCSPTGTVYGSYNKYSTNLGFGYDEVHNDYKVVEFNDIDVDGGSFAEVNVYSRKSNSWKVLTNWPGGDVSSFPGQFLNGSIHWSVKAYDIYPGSEWFIVAQDLASDVFVKLSDLPNSDDDVVEVEVQILDGCLALCFGYKTYMKVWVMKQYGVGESWINVVRIPYFRNIRGRWDQPWPLLFLEDGKILINYGRSLRIYDSSHPQPHQFASTYDSHIATATTFFESLVSPNYLDEEDV
ncbi:hypothetical protein ACS0TY_003071 [Phlomoides rotata]